MAGMNPNSAPEVNSSVGMVLRQFVMSKDAVNRSAASLAPLDLKVPPYSMTEADETLIKSAINDLDTVLDGVDMTFISRLIGIY
jgi:hypothetical protein